MKQFFAGVVAVLALLANAAVARADQPSVGDASTLWERQDTARYVVSTLNVLRTADGRAIPPLLAAQFSVDRYAVWQDLTTNAYVIQFKNTPGRNIGMAVYRLGWTSPRSYSRLTDGFGIPRATPPIPGHFATHQRVFLSAFASTRPE